MDHVVGMDWIFMIAFLRFYGMSNIWWEMGDSILCSSQRTGNVQQAVYRNAQVSDPNKQSVLI